MFSCEVQQQLAVILHPPKISAGCGPGQRRGRVCKQRQELDRTEQNFVIPQKYETKQLYLKNVIETTFGTCDRL